MKNRMLKISIFLIMLSALVLTAAAFAVPPRTAYAEATQKEVIKAVAQDFRSNEYASKSGVYLYAQKSGRQFYIPESYYLEQIEPVAGGTVYYNVLYCGATFLIDVIEVPTPLPTEYFDEDELLSPNVALTVKDGAGSRLTGDLKDIDNTYHIRFLGYAFEEDSNEIYVSASIGDKTYYGFAPVDAFEAFNVPYQKKTQSDRDAYLAQLENQLPAPEVGALPAPQGSLALKIILIIGICVPAVIIMILLFVPSKTNRSYARNTRRDNSTGHDYDERRSYPQNDRPDDRGYDRGNGYDRGYDRGYDYDDPNRRR